MADCERGLGRPERALALASSDDADGLDPEVQVELAMVVSGARLDLGEPEAALAALSTGPVAASAPGQDMLAARVAHARAAALEALGRHDDATAELARFSTADLAAASGEVADDVVVFDLEDDADAGQDGGVADARPEDDRDVAGERDGAGADLGAPQDAGTVELTEDVADAEGVAAAAEALAALQAAGADVDTTSTDHAQHADEPGTGHADEPGTGHADEPGTGHADDPDTGARDTDATDEGHPA